MGFLTIFHPWGTKKGVSIYKKEETCIVKPAQINADGRILKVRENEPATGLGVWT